MASNGQTSPLPEPILFTFPASVFARRISRYLNLRSLSHMPIRVPPQMPRAILSDHLSINHRRIPLLALGRDVYVDTRLILAKLETLFPNSPEHPTLGAKDGFGKGFEEMLEGWVIDAGPFWRTSGCIPPQSPFMRSDSWVKDRNDGSGGAFSREALRDGRKWCISQLRIFFGVMENMLSDGRAWILGDGERPGLADIHAGWVYDWGINMADAMDVSKEEANEATADMKKCLSADEHPRVHDWIKRFRKVCDEAARQNVGGRECGEGTQAEEEIVRRILQSDYTEPQELPFDADDILGLKMRQVVSIAPTDFGFTHADQGTLVGLSRNEAVIEIDVQGGKQGTLRLHFPRIDFKITPVELGP